MNYLAWQLHQMVDVNAELVVIAFDRNRSYSVMKEAYACYSSQGQLKTSK